MFRKIKENKLGTSLLELVVAVTIFSITIVSATKIFEMVITGQRNAIAAQNLQESMRYAFESMTKEMRGAIISNDTCESLFSPEPTATNKVYNITTNAEGDILYFKNTDGVCVVYYLESGSMMVARGSDIASTVSNQITISNLNFSVVDDGIGVFHSIQPRVTMRMDIEAQGKELHKQTMEMQTTISSRYYE